MIQEYSIELTIDCQIKTNKEIRLPTENQAVAHCTIINSTGEKMLFKAKCGDGENIINCEMDNNGKGFVFPRFSSTGYKELIVYGYTLNATGEYEITYSPEPVNFYVPKGCFTNQGVDVTPSERDEILRRLDKTDEKLEYDSKFLVTLDTTTIPESDQEGNNTIISLMNDMIYAIERCAFKNCRELRHASCGNVNTLGESTFEGCLKLASAYFYNLLYIPKRAFKNCLFLNKIKCDHATDVCESAFEGCTSLKECNTLLFEAIDYLKIEQELRETKGDIKNWSKEDIKRVDAAKRKTNNFMTIGENAFKNCTSLETFTVNGGATLVDSAFEGCTSLNKVFLLGQVLLTKATEISADDDWHSYICYNSIDEYRFPENTAFYCYSDDVEYYSTNYGWRTLYEAGRIQLIDPPSNETEENIESVDNTEHAV